MFGPQIMPKGEQSLGLAQRVALVLEILATYCVVRWQLRSNDVRNVIRAAKTPVRPDDELVGRRLGYAVSQVLRLLPTESVCLMRSLVLMRLLARRGLACSVVLGVSAGSEFAAHAWVEHGGRALLPTYDPVFTRLTEL
jgi:hypothetical protein